MCGTPTCPPVNSPLSPAATKVWESLSLLRICSTDPGVRLFRLDSWLSSELCELDQVA